MSKRPGTISNENAKPLAKKAKFVYWSTALVRSMEDPKLIVRGDDLVTVIKDAYPKAEFHYLILPKQDITSLKVLTKEHIELLKHMDKVAKEVINQDQHKNKKFNLGYHAEPSLARLHLHIISDDMNSPCVKTKKHWNSFTSEFFLKSEGKSHQILPTIIEFKIFPCLFQT